MVCVEVYRSVPRYLAAKAAGKRAPGLISSSVAPLRLVSRDEPSLPSDGWTRVRPRLAGICGSDLNTISGNSSFYFSALVSFPFVPGHEVVGDVLEDVNGFAKGQRVVLDPVLSCRPRGIEPECISCSSGSPNLCERVSGGHVSPGLQTGYCKDTGGGWSASFIAHASQLHPIPEEMSDESAVMVEPLACAIHAVRRANVLQDGSVLVVGAGTVGLLTLIALREYSQPKRITVVAKYPAQAQLARYYGASDVVSVDDALGTVRRSTRAFRLEPERSSPFLLGGVDVAFDAVGSAASLGLALRTTRARGRVVISGMPAPTDLSPAWFRELELVGAYSGSGAFREAIELSQQAELGKLIAAAYPLERWREAIDHAMSAGSLGAVKLAFDPRLD